MTLEEGLLALLAAAAGILLFVGLAQALDARPAVRSRRRPGSRPGAVHGAAASARPMVTEAPPRAPYTGPERRRSPRPGSRVRPSAGRPAPPAPPVAAEAGRPDLSVTGPATPDAPAAPVTDPAVDALERALALQRERRHADVIETAVPHLESESAADSTEPSFSHAALWALVGISRHALGDVEGTQGALAAAVRVAPAGVSEGCPERIVAMAAPAAQHILAATDGMSVVTSERVSLLRMAVLWLEWRIVASPATGEVSVLLDKAREALWDGYALAGHGLLRRRQFAEARSLVRQALESEDLPANRRGPLAELAAQGVVRQIGRLVATARATEAPEADALDALERAREVLAATSAESISPGRWHAANRRVWNGYTRLARRQIEGFDLEAAVRPLLRALQLRDLDLGLERKTRELLARTIERIADGAGETIGRLLKAGDRDAAMQRWQDVRGLIQKGRDQGLSHEELAQAFSRARQMLEQIEAVKR